MLTLAHAGRTERLSGGLWDSNDFGTAKDRMAIFMAAGSMSFCDAGPGAGHGIVRRSIIGKEARA